MQNTTSCNKNGPVLTPKSFPFPVSGTLENALWRNVSAIVRLCWAHVCLCCQFQHYAYVGPILGLCRAHVTHMLGRAYVGPMSRLYSNLVPFPKTNSKIWALLEKHGKHSVLKQKCCLFGNKTTFVTWSLPQCLAILQLSQAYVYLCLQFDNFFNAYCQIGHLAAMSTLCWAMLGLCWAHVGHKKPNILVRTPPQLKLI